MPSQEELQQRVTELEEQIEMLKTQLLQSQRLASVGQLSSSITHEFNNILTTVINYAKMGCLLYTSPSPRDSR